MLSHLKEPRRACHSSLSAVISLPSFLRAGTRWRGVISTRVQRGELWRPRATESRTDLLLGHSVLGRFYPHRWGEGFVWTANAAIMSHAVLRLVGIFSLSFFLHSLTFGISTVLLGRQVFCLRCFHSHRSSHWSKGFVLINEVWAYVHNDHNEMSWFAVEWNHGALVAATGVPAFSALFNPHRCCFLSASEDPTAAQGAARLQSCPI